MGSTMVVRPLPDLQLSPLCLRRRLLQLRGGRGGLVLVRLLLRQCAAVAQDGEEAAGGRRTDATGAERVAQRQDAQGRHDEGGGEHWIGARDERHFRDVLMFFSLSFFLPF